MIDIVADATGTALCTTKPLTDFTKAELIAIANNVTPSKSAPFTFATNIVTITATDGSTTTFTYSSTANPRTLTGIADDAFLGVGGAGPTALGVVFSEIP